MNLPSELKESLLNQLPDVMEQVGDATQKIFNPNTIWLESMQFADYVCQLATHLLEGHGPECVEDISQQLLNMAESFKQMGESALTVIDDTEEPNGTQF